MNEENAAKDLGVISAISSLNEQVAILSTRVDAFRKQLTLWNCALIVSTTVLVNTISALTGSSELVEKLITLIGG